MPLVAPRVLVKNASDPRQVAEATESEDRRRMREVDDLKLLLSLVEGRRVLMRFLGRCGVHHSIMETNARIYYNAGQQDLGHWLLAEIGEADPKAYLQMMAEQAKMNEIALAIADNATTDKDTLND